MGDAFGDRSSAIPGSNAQQGAGSIPEDASISMLVSPVVPRDVYGCSALRHPSTANLAANHQIDVNLCPGFLKCHVPARCTHPIKPSNNTSRDLHTGASRCCIAQTQPACQPRYAYGTRSLCPGQDTAGIDGGYTMVQPLSARLCASF